MAMLFDEAANPHAAYVFAHGAGAGASHAFMHAAARALAARGVAVLRFDFPFIEAGSKRPDPPAVAHAAIVRAVEQAARRWPGLPLFAGGKSFGGRMGSQAQAAGLLRGIAGLAFFGFPLHPAGKPSTDRAAHLAKVTVPMLFLQGTRDALAEWPLIERVTRGLGPEATLHRLEGADHAFHVLKGSGRTDAEVLGDLAATAAGWMRAPRG